MKRSVDRIVDRINREVGSDIKNLNKCTNIIKEYQDRITEIEEEVLLNHHPSYQFRSK